MRCFFQYGIHDQADDGRENRLWQEVQPIKKKVGCEDDESGREETGSLSSCSSTAVQTRASDAAISRYCSRDEARCYIGCSKRHELSVRRDRICLSVNSGSLTDKMRLTVVLTRVLLCSNDRVYEAHDSN